MIRAASRCLNGSQWAIGHSRLLSSHLLVASKHQPQQVRCLTTGGYRSAAATKADDTDSLIKSNGLLDGGSGRSVSGFEFPRATAPSSFENGQTVTVHGFLGRRREKSSKLAFCDLDTDLDARLQIVSILSKEATIAERGLHDQFRKIPPFSPVAVTGTLVEKPHRVVEPRTQADHGKYTNGVAWDLKLSRIQPLNSFSSDIIVSDDAVWPPSQRHLQLRFDKLLQNRLKLRSKANFAARQYLMNADFQEYETPVLFKSTPEGAREFLVPTRQPGLAYALPQSPQQYKQVLMASGIRKYFQFARCFRDEDSRADRQPEFTQLDLEMSFATGSDVIRTVEGIVHSVLDSFRKTQASREVEGTLYSRADIMFEKYGASSGPPCAEELSVWPVPNPNTKGFTSISYDDAMACYGSDKPDLRIKSQIRRLEHVFPEDFKKMITHLEDPIIEAVQFKLGGTPSENLAFVRGFMDNLPKTTLKLKKQSTPGVFIFDETKPLNGLSAFGHEAGEQIAAMADARWPRLQHGDLLLVHARERKPFQGEGWTELGRLRKAIYDAAVTQGLIDRDISFRFCWVTDFPLFTTDIEPGEGQGGAAGVKSTHHPFTAPKAPLSPMDREAIEQGRPWEVKADHYDLVLNGTEIGGGSRRIHQRQTQEYVMRKVLQMSETGIQRFRHLLDALDAGCPPHAGFAIGWDRFMTLLFGVDSVRDVLAFPKNQKGEDLLAGSPSQMTTTQLQTYHLGPTTWTPPTDNTW